MSIATINSDDLTRLLIAQRGVIGLSQALPIVGRAEVRRRVRSGLWRPVHRAVFVTHNGPLGDQQRLWIATLAAGPAAVIAGTTALALHGLPDVSGVPVHLLLPAGYRETNPPAGVLVHRTRQLEPAEVTMVNQLPCTTVERSVVDAAAWADSDGEARMLIAEAFTARLVTIEGIRAALYARGPVRRHRLTWLAAHEAARGGTVLAELDVVRLLRQACLPMPDHQRVRSDRAGRHLILSYEEYGLHLEIDGSHDEPDRTYLDADRHNQLWRKGDCLLRFPSWLVRERPAEVTEQIKACLISAGWRPRR